MDDELDKTLEKDVYVDGNGALLYMYSMYDTIFRVLRSMILSLMEWKKAEPRRWLEVRDRLRPGKAVNYGRYGLDTVSIRSIPHPAIDLSIISPSLPSKTHSILHSSFFPPILTVGFTFLSLVNFV
jgi:hypothetical protein